MKLPPAPPTFQQYYIGAHICGAAATGLPCPAWKMLSKADMTESMTGFMTGFLDGGESMTGFLDCKHCGVCCPVTHGIVRVLLLVIT